MSTLLFGKLVLIIFPLATISKNNKGILQYRNLCKLENVVQISEVNMDSIASQFSCKQIYDIYDQIINHISRKVAKTQMDDRQESEKNNVTVTLNNDNENDSYRSGELNGRTVIVHDPLSLLNLSASSGPVNESRKKPNNLKLKSTNVINEPLYDIKNSSLDQLTTQKLADIIGCRLEVNDSQDVFQKKLASFRSKGRKFKEHKHPSVMKIATDYPKMNLSAELIQTNLFPNVAISEEEIFGWYVKRFTGLQEKLTKMTSTQIPGKGMYKLHCGCCNVNFEVGEMYIRGLDLLRNKLSKLKIVNGSTTTIFIERDPNEIIEIEDEEAIVEPTKKIVPQVNNVHINNQVSVITKPPPLLIFSPPSKVQVSTTSPLMKIIPKSSTPVSQNTTKPPITLSQIVIKPPSTPAQVVIKPPSATPAQVAVAKTSSATPAQVVTKLPFSTPAEVVPKPPSATPTQAVAETSSATPAQVVTKPAVTLTQVMSKNFESPQIVSETQKSPQILNKPLEMSPQIQDVQVLSQAASPKITIESLVETPQVFNKSLAISSQVVTKPVTVSSNIVTKPVTVSYQIFTKPPKSSQVVAKSPRKPIFSQLKRNGMPLSVKKNLTINKPTISKASTQAISSFTPTTTYSLTNSNDRTMPKMMLLSDLLDNKRPSISNVRVSPLGKNKISANKQKSTTKHVENSKKVSTSTMPRIQKVLENIPKMHTNFTKDSSNTQQHISVQSLYDKYTKIIIPKTVMHSDVAPVVVLNSGEVCDWYLERMNDLKRLVRKYKKKSHKPTCSTPTIVTTTTTSSTVENNSNSLTSFRHSKARLMNFCEIDSDGEGDIVDRQLGATLNDLLNKPVNPYISQVTLKRARTETIDEHGNKRKKIFREHKVVSSEGTLDENFIEISDGIPAIVDDDKVYKCQFCFKTFMGISQLMYHYKIHLYCKTCKKRFKSVDNMMTHLRNHCVVNARRNTPCLKLHRVDAVVNIAEAKSARNSSITMPANNSPVKPTNNSIVMPTKKSSKNNNFVVPTTKEVRDTSLNNTKNIQNVQSKIIANGIQLKELVFQNNSGVSHMVMSSKMPPKLIPTSNRNSQTASVSVNSNIIQQPSSTNTTNLLQPTRGSLYFDPSAVPTCSQSLSVSSMQPPPLINTNVAPRSFQISKPQHNYVANQIQLQSLIQQQQQQHHSQPGQLKNAINSNYNKIFLLNNVQGGQFMCGGQVVINNENAYLVTSGNQPYMSNPIATSYNPQPNFNVLTTATTPIMQQLNNQPSGLEDHSYHQQRVPVQDENVDVVNKNNAPLQPSGNNSDAGVFKLRVKSLHELR